MALTVFAVFSAGIGEEDSPAAFPGAVRRGQIAPGPRHLLAPVAPAVVGEHLAVGRVRNFADANRAIPTAAKQLRHRLRRGSGFSNECRWPGVKGRVRTRHARTAWAAACQHRIARSAASRHRGEVVGEQNALRGQPVEIRRPSVLHPVTPQFGSQVVNGDEQDVESVGVLGGRCVPGGKKCRENSGDEKATTDSAEALVHVGVLAFAGLRRLSTKKEKVNRRKMQRTIDAEKETPPGQISRRAQQADNAYDEAWQAKSFHYPVRHWGKEWWN